MELIHDRIIEFYSDSVGYRVTHIASNDGGYKWKITGESSARSPYASIGSSWCAWVTEDDGEYDGSQPFGGCYQIFKTWDDLETQEFGEFDAPDNWVFSTLGSLISESEIRKQWDQLMEVYVSDPNGNGATYRAKEPALCS